MAYGKESFAKETYHVTDCPRTLLSRHSSIGCARTATLRSPRFASAGREAAFAPR